MNVLRQTAARLFRHYGMAGVLVLLCAYYSLVTRIEMQPTGAEAARQLARRVTSGGPVLIVGRATDEDRAFVVAFEAELRDRGVAIAKAEGEPRDARAALEQLAAAGKPLGFIATTADCATWTILQNVSARFSVLGQPQFLVPETTRWPAFLTRQNLLNVANQITVVAILAAGMTVVIIT